MGRLLLISLLLVLSACCSQGDVCTDDDRKALEKAIASFYQAVEDGDGEAAVVLFDNDFIMMPNGGTLKAGKDNIAENWKQGVETGFKLRNIEMVDMDFQGNIAYRINQYEYGWPDESGELQWYPTKNIHIWKKQTDGSWKLYADIWNSSPE